MILWWHVGGFKHFSTCKYLHISAVSVIVLSLVRGLLLHRLEESLSPWKPRLVRNQVIFTVTCTALSSPRPHSCACSLQAPSEHQIANVWGLRQCFAFNHFGLILESRLLLFPLCCHVNLRAQHEKSKSIFSVKITPSGIFFINLCMLINNSSAF